MKALSDLFSTDYGLMSVGVIAFTIFLGGFYAVWFTRKMNEDAKNAGK
jgi:NhaP-type Na+/H+ or K+/H+ antiporter